jgi:gas vesicle protein
MSHEDREANTMLYFLAGVGVGSLIGAAAGLLLAPKSGAETRQDLSLKFDEIKGKFGDWVKERRKKGSAAIEHAADEVGA